MFKSVVLTNSLIIFWRTFYGIMKMFIGVEGWLCKGFIYVLKGVMGNIQHMLESATVSSLLMVVMDIIIVIARVYPHVFSSCFRVIIYFLIKLARWSILIM